MTSGNPLLHYHKTDEGISVFHNNGTNLGSLIIGDDGYYAWWPVLRASGYIPSDILKNLHKKLDELNKEWDEGVEEFFR